MPHGVRIAALSISLSLIAAAVVAAPAVPRSVPHFTLPTRDSTVVSDSLRGHVVYVDFWASWCGPCRKTFPWLAGLHERYAAKGLMIVAVNLDKDRALADKFLAQHPASFMVAFDPQGVTAEAFDVRGLPIGYLVSRTGEILLTHVGYEAKQATNVEARIREECAK